MEGKMSINKFVVCVERHQEGTKDITDDNFKNWSTY
jgi:hypothetical protein